MAASWIRFLVVSLQLAAQLRHAAATGTTPLSDSVASKEEAVKAFAEVERSLLFRDGTGLQSLYEEWKAKFEITYDDPEEDARRFQIFSATVQEVIASNRNASLPYWSGLNRFSAMTWEEFEVATLSPLPENVQQQLQQRGVESLAKASFAGNASGAVVEVAASFPPAVDWQAAGKVTPVKDQKKCGACWAFAAVAVLESRALIQSKTKYSRYPIDLSEQQLIDCANPKFDPSYVSNGCRLGVHTDALNYIARTFSVTEKRYPYKSGAGETFACKSSTLKATASSQRLRSAIDGTGDMGWDLVGTFSHIMLMKAVAKQPVAIAWEAANSFKNYWGGVYRPKDCTRKLNHAMVVVGYDYEASPPVWLVKNSWGTEWGDRGYIKVEMQQSFYSDGVCGMYMYPIAAPTPITRRPASPR